MNREAFLNNQDALSFELHPGFDKPKNKGLVGMPGFEPGASLAVTKAL